MISLVKSPLLMVKIHFLVGKSQILTVKITFLMIKSQFFMEIPFFIGEVYGFPGAAFYWRMSSAWMVLLVEPLHGVTFALAWTAAIDFVKKPHVSGGSQLRGWRQRSWEDMLQ